MPILAGDIKLVASQVMNDVPEGGGAPTAIVIADGVSNAIFPDISELDRAGGRVNMRKLHVTVQTLDTDTYMGSNIIVAEPPADPNVSITMFSTESTFDRRTAAASRIESYLNKGPEWNGALFENHIAGQRSIQILCRPTTDAPTIGHTLVLVQNEGLSNEVQQYVRTTRVTEEIRQYYDAATNTDYDAKVVSAELSDALRTDFIGSPPSRGFTRLSTAAKLRDTLVADAGTYVGVVPLTATASMGDLTVQAAGVYSQLVPSAQTEIPMVDFDAAGMRTTLVTAADGTISYTTSAAITSSTALSLGASVVPGTLSIVIGAVTLLESGGQIFEGATAIGLVDYALGIITFAGLSASYSGTKTVAFKPAAAPLSLPFSAQRPVTQESRSYNYIATLVPTPAPGGVTVAYRANARWYELRDTGGGVLKGSDTSFGAGTVNYATGSVALTTGALPDANSQIIFSWSAPTNYTQRSALSVAPSSVVLSVTQGPIEPGSVTISWTDGTAKTAVDDALGNLSGNATGKVYYDTGIIHLSPSLLPAGGQEYSVAYSQKNPSAQKSEVWNAPVREGNTTINITATSPAIKPGSVALTWPVVLAPGYALASAASGATSYVAPAQNYARDNGSGALSDSLGRAAGTVNYATGLINFQPDGNASGTVNQFAYLAPPAMAGSTPSSSSGSSSSATAYSGSYCSFS